MQSFSNWVNTRFRVLIAPGETVEMEMTEVAPAPVGASGGAGHETFSVIFTGPVAPILPQRIYGFENESVGRFDLFIVPIGRGAEGIRYQAAFNRLIKPAQAD